MVFSPAWGGMSPIPLVQQGALRDWLEAVRGIRRPVPVSAGHMVTPASVSSRVGVVIASAGLMAAYARIVGVAPEQVDTGQLFRDIQMFLRSQGKVKPEIRERGTKTRPGVPGPVSEREPFEHDYEFEEFFSWIERRRYRGRGFYTPSVRGTM